MTDLPGLEVPVIGAGMAGGPSTPELVAAVAGAGGLGLLAGAYKTTAQLRDQITRTRELTGRPFGVNLFVPTDSTEAGAAQVEAYRRRLMSEACAPGTELPQPDWAGTDEWADKLDLLLADPVAVVSFHFGAPPPELVERLHAAGSRVVVSATDADEAVAAQACGADTICVQAAAAGGHRGTHRVAKSPDDEPLLPLLRRVRAVTSVPLVAAGGVSTAEDVRAALGAGAVAVQVGTALLRTPEAGTSRAYRDALVAGELAQTVVTRAFTGRPARVLRNRFTDRFGEHAPAVFPMVQQVVAPLRAAAAAAGDVHALALYAGTGHLLAAAEPAADVVRALAGG